jgi:hypothetical protein
MSPRPGRLNIQPVLWSLVFGLVIVLVAHIVLGANGGLS